MTSCFACRHGYQLCGRPGRVCHLGSRGCCATAILSEKLAEKAGGSGGAWCLLSRCFATCGEDTAGCLVRRMQTVKPPEGYVGSGVGGFMSAGKERGGGEKRVLDASGQQPPARPRLRQRKRHQSVWQDHRDQAAALPKPPSHPARFERHNPATSSRKPRYPSRPAIGPASMPLEMGARGP